jgi:lysophospholipase L1-like esterase
LKVAVFGDSIAYGMGARGRPFGVVVAERLDAELVDLTDPAIQVSDSLSRAEAASGCDVVLINHGATEAMIRPSDSALRFVPARWRKAGGLDPRTYFSTRLGRRLFQRALSGTLWRLKLVLMRFIGTTQWTGEDEFAEQLADLVRALEPSRVLILGPLAIDERFFPGSDRQFELYSDRARQVASETGAEFLDVRECCDRWADYCDDHFHPSVEGHAKVAERVLSELRGPE